MPQATFTDLLQFLYRVSAARHAKDLGDAELLKRFVEDRDEAAFSALVRRHGPMVLGVCRRSMGDAHLAEDAFQATFMVLAQRAGSVRKKGFVAGWLHGVAQRIALKARARNSAARHRERRTTDMPQSEPLDELTSEEVRAVLDEEIGGLPEKYRAPIVLCHLEGRSYEQAARELGCSKSTLAKRVTRARELLRRQLVKRGITLSASALATVLTEKAAPAAVAAMLAVNTVKAAMSAAAGKAVAGGTISAQAIFLAEEGMKATIGMSGKVAALVLTLGMAVGGVGLAGYGGWNTPRATDVPAVQEASRTPRATATAVAHERQRLEKNKDQKKNEPAVDLFGDPLPAGAMARLGTVRWRGGETNNLVFSPDNKLLIGSTGSGFIVRDVATGKEVRRFPGSMGLSERGLSISPDGAILAAFDSSPPTRFKVSLWERQTGKELRTLSLPAAKNPFSATTTGGAPLSFTPNGKKLIVVAAGKCNVFDVVSGELESSFAEFKSPRVNDLAISPDGQTLAMLTNSAGLQLWNIADGKLVRSIEDPVDPKAVPSAVAFSLDGNLLAWGPWDRINLCDPRSGQILGRLESKMEGLQGIGITPDGKTVVSGSQDGIIRVWDVATGKLRHELHSRMTGRSMALSPDGKKVAIGTAGTALKLWDVDTGKELTAEFKGHDSEVWRLAFSPDGKYLFSSEFYEQIHQWDTANWKLTKTLPGGRALTLSFTLEGNRLAWAGSGRTARIWDLPNDKEGLAIKLPDKEYLQRAIISADGNKLFTWSNISSKEGGWGPNYLRQWDATTGKQEKVWNFPKQMYSPLMAPDGMTVLVGENREKVITLYDVKSGKQRALVTSEPNYMRPHAYYQDGRMLATGEAHPHFALRLWDMITESEVFELTGHTGNVSEACWSADGRFVASADDGQSYPSPKKGGPTVRLWDAVAGKELAQFGDLKSTIRSVSISPDNSFLAVGLQNSTILIWDISQPVARAKLQVKQLKSEELEACWNDLSIGNARKAHDVAWTLITSPQQSIAFLRERLKPVAVADAAKVTQWIADLASYKFAVRDSAAKALEQVGKQLLPLVEKALKENLPLETRRRLELLASKLEGVPGPETLRVVRAIMVLEKIATPESRSVLEVLAKGAPLARETEEAQSALARLVKLTKPGL